VPVTLAEEPEAARVDQAVERGPHASSYQHVDFLGEEFAQMESKGHWVLLPFNKVRHLPALHVSPMGVVPQAERRPRTIVDYTLSGVNQRTVKGAPAEAMQFGRALLRILHSVVYAEPGHGLVFMFKLDIADGFYRLWIRPPDVPKLAVAYPCKPGEEQLIAFPLALPMGWVESPPYFCSVTEKITDLANQRLKEGHLSNDDRHRLDEAADTYMVDAPEPQWWTGSAMTGAAPLAAFDVYVDGFIGVAQGTKPHLKRVRRTLFETVDQVLRPLDLSDQGTQREEPVSVKKLRKGDGAWATRKVILGWLVDTVQLTIELTPRKVSRLTEILSIPTTKKRMSLRRWQQMLGQLRHYTFAIPSGRYLFSVLQEATTKTDTQHKVRLTDAVHDALEDFRWIVTDLSTCPTHLYEWFPDKRYYLGACDASKAGMGGIWFPHGPATTPFVWRAPFPKEVQQQVVSDANPKGTITNSDLELAATIVQLDIAIHSFAMPLQTLSVLSDNAAAVAWQTKGSTTTTSATAYLLRLQGLHQRHHRYHSVFNHIAGEENAMADTASRSFATTQSYFFATFTSLYPQTPSWQLLSPCDEILSAVNSALSCTRPTPESFLPPADDKTSSGKFGRNSSTRWDQSTRQQPTAILTYAT
jgi:hypothetical protein